MRISNEFKYKANDFINNAKDYDEYSIIILIETYFRPPSLRFLEYILYGVLKLVCPQRASKMTIGLNQLKAIYWVDYLNAKGKSVGLLKTILACENVYKAKETTKIYLESKNFNFDGKERISFVYTGRNNLYYDSLYSFAYSKLLCRNQYKFGNKAKIY